MILTSLDGLIWTEKDFDTNYFPWSIAYGNGHFVISCGPKTVLISDDGQTWTPKAIAAGPNKIAYGNGLFAGIGDKIFYTSTDGENWTKTKAIKPYCLKIAYAGNTLLYGGNTFLAVGGVCNTQMGAILSSPDGVTWTLRYLGSGYLEGATFGDGTFVVVGGRGEILQSDHVTGPRISATPASLTFTNTEVGTSPEQLVTVQNDGTENLDLGTIEAPSTPFSKSEDQCSGKRLAPLESCEVKIRFAPTSIGSSTASLVIPSNDPDNPELTVDVTGTSMAVDLTGNGSSATYVCNHSEKGVKCKITAGLDIQNIGNRDAPSSQVSVYLSDDDKYDRGAETVLKPITTGKIPAGATKSKNLSFNLPVGMTASGKYIIAVIDEANVINEIDKKNNVIVRQLQ